VPGTDIIVPPDVVIWSVTLLLTLGAAALIWRRARAARHRRMHVPVIIHETEEKQPAMPMVSDGAVHLTHIHSGLRVRAVGRHIRGFMLSMITLLGVGVRRSLSALDHARRISLTVTRVLMTALYRSLRLVLTSLARGSILLVRRTATLSVKTWRRAKPRLRKFDAWLEGRVRKIEKWFARAASRDR
jgi:hypothetical protein